MYEIIIDSESAYDKALERYKTLRKKKELTQAEHYEVHLINTRLKDYENSLSGHKNIDPIKLIKIIMEQNSLKNRDLEPFIGSKGNVSEILNKMKPLSLPMIRRLSAGLMIPIELLVSEYELKQKDELELTPSLKKAVYERDYIEFSGELSEFNSQSAHLVPRYVNSVLGEKQVRSYLKTSLHYQEQHKRSSKKMDASALLLWQTRVIQLASMEDTIGVYQPEKVDKDFVREIAKLSRFSNGPIMAREELSRNGISLVICKHLPKTYLDGAVLPGKSGAPVIGMTLRYDRLDNFWFVLLHELSHVVKHFNAENTVFVDDLDVQDTSEIEKEADQLASDSIMTDSDWNNYKPFLKSQETVKAVAQEFDISSALVAGRYRKESGDYKKFNRLVGNKMIRCRFEEYEKY